MIELHQLTAGYEHKAVLKGIDLQFETGKITVLVGPNGCGKSTLLKTIVRLVEIDHGQILIDSCPISSLSAPLLAQRVAYCAQNRKAPEMEVLKMILHGRFAYLRYPRRYRPEDLAIARQALHWANLDAYAEERVSKLSGGMQQKAYLAMALAQDAETILLDEPTSYLDIVHQLRLMELVRTLAQANKAVVMVLHDLTMALEMADHLVVMKEGQILFQGNPKIHDPSLSIEEAFEVKLERIAVPHGWHYHFRLRLEGEEK